MYTFEREAALGSFALHKLVLWGRFWRRGKAVPDAHLPPPGRSCKMESMDGAGSTSKIYFPEFPAAIQIGDDVGVEVVSRSAGGVVTATDCIGLGCRQTPLGPPKWGGRRPNGAGTRCMSRGPASSPPELCCQDRGRKHATGQRSREVEFSWAKFSFPMTRLWLPIRIRVQERLCGTGAACSEASPVGRQSTSYLARSTE
jgi:hypothetical protein